MAASAQVFNLGGDCILDDGFTGIGQLGVLGIDYCQLQQLHGDIHGLLKSGRIVVMAKVLNDPLHSFISIVAQLFVLGKRNAAVLVNIEQQLFQCFGDGSHTVILSQ